MSEPSQQPLLSSRAHPAAPLLETSRWLPADEDIALGCECADPSLQIDEWRQQIAAAPKGI